MSWQVVLVGRSPRDRRYGGVSVPASRANTFPGRDGQRVRKAKGITQAELAKRVGTKQSGVARMLNNPDTSTMDNLIKALIALGEPISKIAACLLLCSNN